MFLAVVKEAALPVVFWLNVGQLNVPVVKLPDNGVPNAPPFTTNDPAVPTFTPSAVNTPVPVVIVEGAIPAPPPITRELEASVKVLPSDVVLSKKRIPPDVPEVIPIPPLETPIGNVTPLSFIIFPVRPLNTTIPLAVELDGPVTSPVPTEDQESVPPVVDTRAYPLDPG